MRPADFDITKVADTLEGTARTLSEVLEEDYAMLEDDLTPDDLAQLDTLVFKCEACGWWYESGEAHANPSGDGDICADCAGE